MALSLSITKLPWKTQLAVFGLLAVAAVGGFYYLYEIPAQAEMTVQKTELATIQGRLEKGRATARRLPEFKKQVEENHAELERLRGRLPEEKDAADLLRRIEGLARQSGLTIRAFKPQPVANKGMHAEWPISLELEGTYHNLGSFLDSVSKLPRLINVSKIDIKTRAKQEPNQTVAVTCTATTFVLLEGATAPGAAPGAPKKTE